MFHRGRSESPSSIGCKSSSKRSDSQESKYSGDTFFNALQDDDFRLLDETVALELEAEFDNTLSRYRISTPPSSPGKRKIDEFDDVDDQQSVNKLPKSDGHAHVHRSDSNVTAVTSNSSDSSESPPPFNDLPANPMHIVAFSPIHQTYFDKHLSWGAQWEIARLVTLRKLNYPKIELQKLTPLHGKDNADSAAEIEKIFCPTTLDTQSEELYQKYFAAELEGRNPWAELDNEERRLKEDPLCGLGCNSLHNDWYGGKIAFTARLRKEEDRNFFLQLDKPQLSTSTRFGRRWGSRRFIRVRIPDDLLYAKNNDLMTFFKQDFVIHGRIFRSLYSKEHTIFLVQLAERTPDSFRRIPDPTRSFSFPAFLEWHNPMFLNKKQTLAKWCARMSLGLSNSVPGLQFQLENIHETDDIYSLEGQAARREGKSPDSKFILTDGTGYCNYAVLSLLTEKFAWNRRPSAIQFRMYGAKGLLVLHPTEDWKSDDSPQIWLRPSQKKINYEKTAALDRAHLILDVLRRSEFRAPARLSTEIVVNLAENGVSYATLQDLMNVGLGEIAASLTTWSGPYAMQHLWDAISKINGSVFQTRAAREAIGKSRLLGLGYKDWEEEQNGEEEHESVQGLPKSKPYWTDEISGCPANLEETAMVLLDAGFEPQSCGVLARVLKEIFKKALSSYIDRYKIVVQQSGEGWMIPDPYGVLEPDEIFLKAPGTLFEIDGILRDHLRGPVLITRHPCRVASDVQKVQAVWRDELARYSDVVVCSSRGTRSLASMLGGGDYDGDTAFIIWEPRIVEEFRNPNSKFADPPASVDDAFYKNTKLVETFLGDFDDVSVNRKMLELQEYLLSTLVNTSLVGQYSGFHDVAVYRFGYTHDEAWRLAYMFCTVLDSGKTGKTVKRPQLAADRQQYNTRAPQWRESLYEERDNNKPFDDRDHPKRETATKFIMDVLKEGGRREYDYHLKLFEDFLSEAQEKFKLATGYRGPPFSGGYYLDPVLRAPHNEIRRRANEISTVGQCDFMLKEVKILEEHVKKCYETYKEHFRTREACKKSKQEWQDQMRRISLMFTQSPQDFVSLSRDDVELFKASYAYELDSEREVKGFNCTQFPFDVAMRNICLIKAKSLGPFKAVSSRFYSVLEMSPVIKKFKPSNSGYIYTP